MKMLHVSFMLTLSTLLFAVSESPKSITLKNIEKQGKVEFLAIGKPSMLKIHGKAPSASASLKVEGTKLTGTAAFPLESLDTGINLRNEHMKEKYLKVKEFPNATLSIHEAEVDPEFASTLSNKGEKDFKGTLELHGKKNSVEGKYTAKSGVVQAKFQLKITDYGIEIPSYLGVKVAEVVDVNVELPLKKD